MDGSIAVGGIEQSRKEVTKMPVKRKRMLFFIGAIIWFVLFPCTLPAAGPFYEGKTINLMVGSAPGGGFDISARLLARHLGKHIPGNPTVIVQNMPGAGTLLLANYFYKMAKPDGLSIGKFSASLLFGQILGQEGIEFDARKFIWVGTMEKGTSLCIFTKTSGITNMDKLLSSKTSLKIGGTTPGEAMCDIPKLLKNYLSLPFKVIEGYKGTPEVRLAMIGKEVDGAFNSWGSAKATWRRDLEAGDFVVVLQLSDSPLPDLPNVPLAINYAKTEEARQVIKVIIQGVFTVNRLFALPPATPQERVEVLRKAFYEALKDEALLAEAKQARIDIDPQRAEKIEEVVTGLTTDIKPATVAKLKEILYGKY